MTEPEKPEATQEEEIPPRKKRDDEDTIRHTLMEVGSKAHEDLAESVEALRKASEQSGKSARSLALESRRTRMASRPGMKRPDFKK